MRIARDSYLNKLVSHQNNGLVKVVTGVRRCGKSFLLFHLFKEYLLDQGVPSDHIIEIQLDNRQFKDLRNPDVCDEFVRSKVGIGQYYALIDEVQLMPEFEDVLNGFLHMPNLDVYVTGSNSRFLSSDVITEFRGRGDEIRIHPLSFAEYHAAKQNSWSEDWNNYMTYGGMPFLASLEDNRDKIDYLERLFRETYLTDIIERNHLRNDAELEELVEVIASVVGSLTNPQRLTNIFKSKKGLKLSAPTISKYLKYLVEAFLITPAKRYNLKGNSYISTPLKYYFEDVGLRNSVLNFRQQEENHIMENVVFNELICRGYRVDIGEVPTSSVPQKKHSSSDDKTTENKQSNNLEIDFVANEGSKRYYIQSAFMLPDKAKRDQEKRPFRYLDDSFKKIIVVKDDVVLSRDNKGIVTMGLREFLLNPNSLDL